MDLNGGTEIPHSVENRASVSLLKTCFCTVKCGNGIGTTGGADDKW